MEITEEMRRAVYAQDCAQYGHVPDYSNLAVGTEPRALNDQQLPHVVCRRCQLVWVMMPIEGSNYDDAATKLRGKLKNPDDARPRPRQ